MDGVTTLHGAQVAFIEGYAGAGAMRDLWPKSIDWHGWKIDGAFFPAMQFTSYSPRRTRTGNIKWERQSGGAFHHFKPSPYSPMHGAEAFFIIDDAKGNRVSDRLNVARGYGRKLSGASGPYLLTSSDMIALYGIPESRVVRLSQYTPPPIIRNGTTLRRSERAYTLDASKTYCDKWEIIQVDASDYDDVYYVPVTTRAPEGVATRAAKWLQGDGERVLGLSPSFIKLLEGEPPRDAVVHFSQQWHALDADPSFHFALSLRYAYSMINTDLSQALRKYQSPCPMWQGMQELLAEIQEAAALRPITKQEERLYSLGGGWFQSQAVDENHYIKERWKDAFRALLGARPIFAMLWEQMSAANPHKTQTIIRSLAITA
jgi:hypothetical protein